MWRRDLRTDNEHIFRYLKAQRWSDGLCVAPRGRRRGISTETKEEFFNSQSCSSSAALEGREGQVRERTKHRLTLCRLQTLRGCVVVLEHCSVEGLRQDHLGVIQNKQVHPGLLNRNLTGVRPNEFYFEPVPSIILMCGQVLESLVHKGHLSIHWMA